MSPWQLSRKRKGKAYANIYSLDQQQIGKRQKMHEMIIETKTRQGGLDWPRRREDAGRSDARNRFRRRTASREINSDAGEDPPHDACAPADEQAEQMEDEYREEKLEETLL